MRQHIEDAYMKPCGPYRACDNCPASPASLKVFVAQGTCNSDTPDPPVWLVVSGIRDNRDGPEQPQYQLDFEVCPASERRSHFELNVRRIALRLAAFCLQEDGLGLPLGPVARWATHGHWDTCLGPSRAPRVLRAPRARHLG
jgi:hypothetical protein